MVVGVRHRDNLNTPATNILRLEGISHPFDTDSLRLLTILGDQCPTRAIGLLQL